MSLEPWILSLLSVVVLFSKIVESIPVAGSPSLASPPLSNRCLWNSSVRQLQILWRPLTAAVHLQCSLQFVCLQRNFYTSSKCLNTTRTRLVFYFSHRSFFFCLKRNLSTTEFFFKFLRRKKNTIVELPVAVLIVVWSVVHEGGRNILLTQEKTALNEPIAEFRLLLCYQEKNSAQCYAEFSWMGKWWSCHLRWDKFKRKLNQWGKRSSHNRVLIAWLQNALRL